MVGFVRRDIPSMSSVSLIVRLMNDKKMERLALEQSRANANLLKKLKPFMYYWNNVRLIENELERREREGEPVLFWGGHWTTAEKVQIMLIEDIKLYEKRLKGYEDNEEHFRKQDLLNHRRDCIIQCQIDIEKMRERLLTLEVKYGLN